MLSQIKKLGLLLLPVLFLLSLPAHAQLGTIQGFCDNGGNHALTSGQPSSNYLQGNIPLCTISVFYHDSTVLAPIFMGESSTGTLKNVQVTAGGSYSVCPTGITFTGGGGSGATATVSCTSGAVVSVAVTSPGSGYTTAPTVGFTGGTGSGATAVATIVGDLTNPFTANIDGSWRVWAAIATGYDITMSGGIPPNSYAQPRTITNIFPNAFGGTSYTIIQANGTASAPVSPVNFINSSTVNFSITGNQISAAVISGSTLAIEHVNSSTGILQNLMNWQDTPANLSGGSLDSGYQPVVFKTDTAGGWAAETLATFSLAPYSTPPIAGQRAIAYPTGFSTTCATGSNTTGKTVVTNGGCNAMVTWTFSAPGGNITTTSGATIPIANVTAVYPFVTSAATIQSGNATPANFFETTCTGTGVTLDVTQQGEQSGTLTFPLHQYTSSTSLTVSLANYNAMTCDISASEIDGSVGTPNIVNGQATLAAAYIYYTGPPVSSPNQYYVQGPLNFDTTTNILSLIPVYYTTLDFGVDGTQYVITNSNQPSAISGLKTTFCAVHANTSTAPTLNMNGWGAWTIFGPTGGALSLNDITPCAGASGTGQMINVQLTQTAAGMQWWLQNPKTEGGSGGVTGSGTANTLTKWTGTSVVGNSSVTDDGTNPTRIPDSIDTNAIYREYTVDTGGVTGGQALCVTGNLDGGGQPKVLACPTTGHGAGFVGIAYQNASAGGLALACWSVGCSALFDGSVTQRDTAIVSTTTAGDLHDTGVTTAPGGENLVVNIAGPNTGAGTRALINITGATPAGGGGGGLPSGVFGQVPTNSGASAGSYLAQSPTVGVANGGAAITSSYTLLCDSATVSVGIQDRGKWAVVGSGGSVTIPDLAGTGCSGFYGGVQNSTSGAVTISRQTSDTFNVYGPTQGAPTTGQTSFSLPAGSWATFNPSTSATVYDVRIETPPASSGSTVNVNGSPVSNPNFNGTTPAAAANSINTNFQVSASNVSAQITGDGNSAHYLSGTGIWSSPSATFAVQHTFTFAGAGTQSFTHNLGTQYPQYSCITTSGTNFSPTWMTWTDANNVSMTAPSATTQVCSFGGTTGSTAVTLPPPCPDSSGSGTAQSCTTTPTITVGSGSCIAYIPGTTNSGTGLTLAVNGGAAASIAYFNTATLLWTTTLIASQVLSGNTYLTCYNGTNWEIQANIAQTSASYPSPVTHTVSGVSEVDFTTCFSSAYADYEIRMTNATITGTSVTFGLQFSTNGGSTYDTGSNYAMGRYFVGVIAGDTSGNNPNTTDTMIRPFLFNNSVSTGAHYDATIRLFNPLGTQALKQMSINGIGFGTSLSSSDEFLGGAAYSNATAVNAFRFISSGTFSGTFTCQPLPQ